MTSLGKYYKSGSWKGKDTKIDKYLGAYSHQDPKHHHKPKPGYRDRGYAENLSSNGTSSRSGGRKQSR